MAGALGLQTRAQSESPDQRGARGRARARGRGARCAGAKWEACGFNFGLPLDKFIVNAKPINMIGLIKSLKRRRRGRPADRGRTTVDARPA